VPELPNCPIAQLRAVRHSVFDKGRNSSAQDCIDRLGGQPLPSRLAGGALTLAGAITLCLNDKNPDEDTASESESPTEAESPEQSGSSSD